MKKKYYPELQSARGILAILVVLGHIVTQMSVSYGETADRILAGMGSVIYSFHMPAFFFISGFVSVKLLDLTAANRLSYIKEKFFRLMIPYFVMGLVYLPARLFLSNMANSSYSIFDFPKILIGENPDGALWFLYVLFFITVFSACLINQRNLSLLLPLSLVISQFAGNNGGIAFTALTNFCIYLFYFLLGLWCRKTGREIEKVPLWGFILSLVLFVGANYIKQPISDYILTIITALSGTLCLLYVCNKLEKIHPRILPLLGDYSMDIFIFSEPIKVGVRYLLRSQPLWIMITGCLLAAVMIPILISKFIVRRIDVFRKLFLGMQKF